jgi:hypothetical protein
MWGIMNKLSVRATIIEAYNFTFRNYFQVLGVVWLPTLIIVGVTLWWFMPRMGAMQQAVLAHDQASILASLKGVLLFEVATLIIVTMLVVGVTRLALGLGNWSQFFYLSAGADFGRLLLAYFIVSLIFFGVVILISIVLGVAMGFIATKMAGPNPSSVAVAASMQKLIPLLLTCLYATMIFIFVRLAFLLPSIVVSEHRIGVGRNWVLTRGNFWRIVGIATGISLPILVLFSVQYSAMSLIGGSGWNFLGNSQAARMAWSVKVMDLYSTYWYFYIPTVLILAPIFNGLIFGGSASVSRALTTVDTEP